MIRKKMWENMQENLGDFSWFLLFLDDFLVIF